MPTTTPLKQVVLITLDDGRQGAFTGPVLISVDEPERRVTDITFSIPTPLPQGCSWERLEPEPKTDVSPKQES